MYPMGIGIDFYEKSQGVRFREALVVYTMLHQARDAWKDEKRNGYMRSISDILRELVEFVVDGGSVQLRCSTKPFPDGLSSLSKNAYVCSCGTWVFHLQNGSQPSCLHENPLMSSVTFL